MTKRISLISAGLMVWALALALLLFMVTPALAHHDAGHAQGGQTASDRDGDADNDSGTADEDSHDVEGEQNPDDDMHPSGKDRSGESGGSGNQGKSESDPDDSNGPMRREAPPCPSGDPRGADACTDKSGGSGGSDRDDQDGNNGCGNDDDFDDDNNGWCGKRKASEPTQDDGGDGGNGDGGGGEVGGDVVVRPVVPELVGGPVPGEVLGKRVNAARPGTMKAPAVGASPARARGAVLPFTGGDVLSLIATGLGLIGTGTALNIKRKN